MAPLKVIGAGFSRTGTDSLRAALNNLGFTTMHMRELLDRDHGTSQMFLDAYQHPEKPVDWDLLYEGYDAAVDLPTYLLLDRLLEVYPDAKVVLTERDADSWYHSFNNTILKMVPNIPADTPQHIRDTQNMALGTILDGVPYDGIAVDEKVFKAKYTKHYEWVKANVPPERLLVFKQGHANYPELCAFLGIKDVPDEPFPFINKSQVMQNYIQDVYRR
ncbi:P-loop containing nucleoside triphosphate hydrolase protein [Syncephalastrum racemosum]|uniref:P-loop containing nucleoside triphosphate hydrolase protein n=1 Tax=Syncephalastrum racemosum TaxID=13706 RepID=A0A1X2HB25_SYNRA|nr:P-loop containing nucleoside triphosphate hydrolase protein [Syncephalastrum racemosum]